MKIKFFAFSLLMSLNISNLLIYLFICILVFPYRKELETFKGKFCSFSFMFHLNIYKNYCNFYIK